MDKAGGQSVIHRKALVARDEYDAREMSPAKALRLALARAGEALYALALRVRTVEQQTVELSAVEETLGDDGLLILLDGAEGERGAIRLDLQFVAGLIEVQLMGHLRKTEAAKRPFTPTDAAIAEPLMNAFLDGTDKNLAAADLPGIAPGLRFGDRVEDGRTLALGLSAPDYDLYQLTIDMDGGAKTGVLTLLLPQRRVARDGADEEGARSLQAKLEENALNSPVMLDAVLGRMRLPLNKICAWKPGAVLPLPQDALSAAKLNGAKGHRVARVRLGQLNGFRAVRLMLEAGETHEVSEVQTDKADPALPDMSQEDSDGWAQVASEAVDQGDVPELPEMASMPEDSPGWNEQGKDVPMAGGLPMLPDLPMSVDPSDL